MTTLMTPDKFYSNQHLRVAQAAANEVCAKHMLLWNGKSIKQQRTHERLMLPSVLFQMQKRSFFSKPWTFSHQNREERCSAVSLASSKQLLCSQLDNPALARIQKEQQQHRGEKATREIACFRKFMGIRVLKHNLS